MLSKKIWLYGPCSSYSSPRINFGIAPFMLANGMWIMSIPKDAVVFVHTTAGAEFCHITEHNQGMNFGSKALYFLKRCWNSQNVHLFLSDVNTCTVWTCMITFVGSYSGLAMQFTVEGHIPCWIVWWIFWDLPKMPSVLKQCHQQICLFLDNHCFIFNCNRTSFYEPLRQTVNHLSWGWVTVEMVMISAACGWGDC